jgi:hypothetical protein
MTDLKSQIRRCVNPVYFKSCGKTCFKNEFFYRLSRNINGFSKGLERILNVTVFEGRFFKPFQKIRNDSKNKFVLFIHFFGCH